MFQKSSSTTGNQVIDPFARNSRTNRSPPSTSNQQPSQELLVIPSEIVSSPANEKAVTSAAVIERMKMFEKLCETLKQEIDDLKIENQRLKDSLTKNARCIDTPKDVSTPPVREYHTDEDELAQETERVQLKKKKTKKRKAESSPEIESSVEALSEVKETTKVSITNAKEHVKKPKLPPVILSNTSDFNRVQEVMTSLKIKHEIKLLNNKQLSMKVFSENDYRSLTKAINEAKFEWHTYENKATRPCKVIARGLHPSCDPEIITNDLKELGFNILSVVNLTRKKRINDKQIIHPLPLFMLTFDHSEDIKKVFSITHIVNIKVKIEAIRKQKDQIPQCKRCQRFEHTQSFCKREARCVKCAGNHLTINCKLDKKAPPKCFNCSEAHPANYRGCIVAKELLKRRLAKKKVNEPKAKPSNQQKLQTPKIIPGRLFSDVAKNTPFESTKVLGKVKKTNTPKAPKSSKESIPVEDPIMSSIKSLMLKIDDISCRLENMERQYASKHIGTPRSILKK